MIQELKELYNTFGDARIDRIDYNILVNSNLKIDGKSLTIYVDCLNWRLDERQLVKFECRNVTKFRFADGVKIQSSVVFEALLEQHESHIVLDFFPIQVDGLGKLEEDPNSTFVVHCKEISYEVII